MQIKTIKSMKGIKTLLGMALAAVLVFCLQATVFANQGSVLTVDTSLNVVAQGSNVDENVPLITPTPEPAWVWHPISVVNEPLNGFNAIRRTYALPPDINPGVISTDDFTMFGQRFTYAYVLQQPTSNESFMEMRETVTIETRSRILDDILPNLEPEIWYDKDGFAGMLTLNIHSVSSDIAGTTRHTSTVTRQRTYPNLSAADNSLVPRTITDGGTTFNLSTVDWQSSSMSTIDGYPVASNFTANATYTAQVTQTRTTGYTTSAEYVGTVFRTTQGKTLYTAYFYGEPIIEVWLDPEPEPTVIIPVEPEATPTPVPPTNEPNRDISGILSTGLIILGILVGLAALGFGGFFAVRHLTGFNVTVYSINGPREIVKAGKIKLDLNNPDPAIILDTIVGRNTAKTDRYIIQIAKRAIPKLVNKVLLVALHDKEATHKVPDKASGVPVYEFEVNFSDDDDEPDLFGDDG